RSTERAVNQDKWYGIQGVGRMRAVGHRIKHLLSIPMISGDHSPAAEVLHCLDKASYAGIKRLYRPYCGGGISCMPHHVSVREVENDSIGLPCTQTRRRRLRDLVWAHLRL